ncbi:hypothetical protein JCGZ_12161 [Jatropha curcas]|uniref:Uncharacterized protein n=1 Tax=Jatropha curcas TaxID=180498 RepID=A0A067KM41_JATCU|nr:hypothetical protein JCGZ_12161 [Jatropha curcas]
MGRKGINPRNLGRVFDGNGEVYDLGCDARLARRLKRRCIANQNFKRTPPKVPEANSIKIDIDDHDEEKEELVDPDYIKYLDDLSSKLVDNSNVSNNSSLDNGNTGGDVLVDDEELEDPDYINYLDGLQLGDGTVSNSRSLNNGNTSGNVLVNDDDDALEDPDYLNYLDGLPLGDGTVSNNRSLDNGNTSGKELVNDDDALEDPDYLNYLDCLPPGDGNVSNNSSLDNGNTSGDVLVNDDDALEDPDYLKYLDGLPPGDGNVSNSRSLDNGNSSGDVLVNDDDALEDPDYLNYLDSLPPSDGNVSNNRSLDNGNSSDDVLVNDDDALEDPDYLNYLDGLPLGDGTASNNVSLDDGNTGSDVLVVDDDDDELEDPDYINYLDDLSSQPLCDSTVSNYRSLDNGNTNDHVLLENRSVNADAAHNIDTLNDGDPEYERIQESISVEVGDRDGRKLLDNDYENFLCNIPSDLEPFLCSDVNKSFVNGGVNVNAVHQSLNNGDATGDVLLEIDAYTNDAFSDGDPQCETTPDSNNIETDDNKEVLVDGAYEEFLSSLPSEPSFDSAVRNDNSVSAGVNAVNTSFQNRTSGNELTEESVDDAYNTDNDNSSGSNSKKNNCFNDMDPHNIQHDRYRVENIDTVRPKPEAAGATKHDQKHKMKCDIVDPCYNTFLSSLKREGKYWVFMPESGGKVVYGEDEESSSDSEVIVMDNDPFADEDYSPFVSSKSKPDDALYEDGKGCIKSSFRNGHSLFRESLLEILRKPYDEKEYEELLGEVYVHRPVKIEKDMRNGRTRVCLAGRSPSYLDLHKDLHRKILEAGSNKSKILNLLRGFFYWLQNLAHEGQFKPWTDSSCLEVFPPKIL